MGQGAGYAGAASDPQVGLAWEVVGGVFEILRSMQARSAWNRELKEGFVFIASLGERLHDKGSDTVKISAENIGACE